jgi:putative addiction module component (TIGR02574 family)
LTTHQPIQNTIPFFKSEAEEKAFWESHDSTKFIDWSMAQKPLLSRSFNMQDLVTTLSAQAQSLSAEDRARLAESLLASLDPRVADVEAAWAQEISKRVAEVESQHVQLIPAENVFAQVRTKLQK